MASAASIFSADQFRCSVCLEVFTDPVSTPCGHNFCRACIAASGDHVNQCPVCRETLDPGQRLCVNAGLRDLAELFKAARTSEGKANEGSPSPAAKPGEVPCDFCLGTKLKAHKSCLVCLASYCHVHLEPHVRVQALKRHRLIGPVGNLEDRVCWKHDVSVEFFCRTDQTRICVTCLRDGHVAHETVSFKEELVSRKAQLYDIDAEVKRKLQRKLLQVEEVKRVVTNSWNESESAKEAMVKAFSDLVASIKASQAELVSAVECRQRSLEGKSRDLIADLELEMADLRRRIVEIEQLSNTEDDFLLLLQNPFPATMHTPSPPKEMPGVFLHPDQIMSMVMCVITQQKDTFRKNMKRVAQEIMSSGTEAIKEAENEVKLAAQEIKSSGTDVDKKAEKEMKMCLGKKTEQLFEEQLMKIQELYSVDVTLDPDTANPFLVVTEDGKQVKDGGVQRYFSCNQKRFKVFKYVAGKEGFSSNLYYEASVNGLMYWDLGVVSEYIIGNEQYLGASQKSWSVCLIQGFYYANTKPPTNIRLTQKPQKIGVFVDYKVSQVSIYDVDNRTLIYSFTGCLFKQGSHRLFPLIGISKTADKMFSSPLTISHVNPGTKR